MVCNMDLVERYNRKKLEELGCGKDVAHFKPGDTIQVFIKIVEGTTERIQVFEGVCIARRHRGFNSTFTVRKISYNEGIERVFRVYSPRISKVEVKKSGKVRRAKLYYLRKLKGKAARISENKQVVAV